MIIIAAYFEERKEYKDLKTIFINSAKRFMLDVDIRIVSGDKINRRSYDHHQDTYIGFKLAVEYVLKLQKPCAVCDIDLMFRGSIESIWERDFDLAVTIRNHTARFNTGVWFYRPTEKSNMFIKQWLDLTEEFSKNINKIKMGLDKYSGLDQYALACIKKKNPDVNVLELLCQEWNAEQTCWKTIDRNTKIVHLKSQLRNELFNRDQRTKYDGNISKNLKKFPECEKLADEARGYL